MTRMTPLSGNVGDPNLKLLINAEQTFLSPINFTSLNKAVPRIVRQVLDITTLLPSLNERNATVNNEPATISEPLL